MKILVISAEPLASVMGKSLPVEGLEMIFSARPITEGVEMILDPNFEQHPEWIDSYRETKIPVLIGSVCYTLEELEVYNAPIARFNFWPAVAGATQTEVTTYAEKSLFTLFFEKMGLVPQWLPDEKGFVSSRVIAAIINEAFLAAEEGVAATADIDTAMQLGTNYPLGPFAWCDHIGKTNVARLLSKLSADNPIYSPAASLRN